MRTRVNLLLLAAAIALVGCAEIFDELGVSPEDREEFEDFLEALGGAAEAAGGGNSNGDGSDDGWPGIDPDWSPDAMPPPPEEPLISGDYSDDSSCPTGWECGAAYYGREEGEAVREHYEEAFGRPPDSDEVTPYGGRQSEWDDGEVRVEVKIGSNLTTVTVESDATFD